MIALATHIDIPKNGIARTCQTSPFVVAMSDIDMIDAVFVTSIIAIGNKKTPWLGITNTGFFGKVMHHTAEGIRAIAYRRGAIHDFCSRQRKGVDGNGIVQVPRSIDGIIHSHTIDHQ